MTLVVCEVCLEAVDSDEVNSVGSCDSVDKVVVVGVTVFVDVESACLVVNSVVIGGIVEVALDFP